MSVVFCGILRAPRFLAPQHLPRAQHEAAQRSAAIPASIKSISSCLILVCRFGLWVSWRLGSRAFFLGFGACCYVGALSVFSFAALKVVGLWLRVFGVQLLRYYETRLSNFRVE